MMPTLHFIKHALGSRHRPLRAGAGLATPPGGHSTDGPGAGETLDEPSGRLGVVFSSAERKATDAARLVADRFGLPPVIVAQLGENDRSATGYLPKAEFETTADLFFAHPERSVRGWERAVDAQRRIVAAVERVIAEASGTGDIAVISHGGVGALLLCHLKGVPISRAEDQPGAGGGCLYSLDIDTRALISGLQLIED